MWRRRATFLWILRSCGVVWAWTSSGQRSADVKMDVSGSDGDAIDHIESISWRRRIRVACHDGVVLGGARRGAASPGSLTWKEAGLGLIYGIVERWEPAGHLLRRFGCCAHRPAEPAPPAGRTCRLTSSSVFLPWQLGQSACKLSIAFAFFVASALELYSVSHDGSHSGTT